MDFDQVWSNIIRHAGNQFHTIKGLRFTYKVEGRYVMTNRTDYLLHQENFRKEVQVKPLQRPSDISYVRGSSYVYAILTDNRIRQ